MGIIAVYAVRHGGKEAPVETVRVDDESGSCIFHGSDVLKVQHSLGGTEGIGGKLPLPCLVPG